LKRKEKRKQGSGEEAKGTAKKGKISNPRGTLERYKVEIFFVDLLPAKKPFRSNYRPYQQHSAWGGQPVMMPQWPMMAPVQYPSFGVQGGGGHGYQRQETRQCLVCSKFYWKCYHTETNFVKFTQLIFRANWTHCQELSQSRPDPCGHGSSP